MHPVRPRRLLFAAAVLAVAVSVAPAAHAQTGYNPPGWHQEQTAFIKSQNPAADCDPRPDPNFEGTGIDAWMLYCEARSISYRGRETTFACSASAEFADSYQAGPGYDCFAWLGSANPGQLGRCARGQNDNPGTPGVYPPDWFIGTYSIPAGGYVPTASFPSRDACLDSLGTTLPPPPPPDPEPEPTPCKLAFASSQKARATGIKLTVKAGPTRACAAKLKAATLHIGNKKYLYVGKLPSRTISADKSWAVKVGLGEETLARVKAALGAGKTVKIAARFTLDGTAAGGISKLTK